MANGKRPPNGAKLSLYGIERFFKFVSLLKTGFRLCLACWPTRSLVMMSTAKRAIVGLDADGNTQRPKKVS